MKLRATLTDCQQFAQTLAHRQIAKPGICTQIQEQTGFVQWANIPPIPPDAQELHKIYQRFGHALATNNWVHIRWYDWRRAPWILWYGQKMHMLAIQTDFLPLLWRQISGNSPALKRLIYIYLQEFSLHKPNIEQVAQFIKSNLAQLDKTSVLYRWQQQQQQYHLFEPRQGIVRLAQACLLKESVSVLAAAGLSGSLQNGGYARSAYRHALKMLEQGLRQQPDDTLAALSHLLEWSLQGRQLRYPQECSLLLQCLLSPWQQRHQAPALLRYYIEVFILRYIGHPALARQYWQEIRPPALKVFQGWFVESQLQVFYTLLENNHNDPRWRYRQNFWQDWLQRGHIDESWLVIHPLLGDEICSRQHNKKLPGLNLTAQLEETHVLENNEIQGVLLLRIKNYLLADFIGGHQILIWRNKNPYAPNLYQKTYKLETLQQHAETVSLSHQNWQHELNQKIV